MMCIVLHTNLDETNSKIVRNHVVSGERVRWNTVLAVTEVCLPRDAHSVEAAIDHDIRSRPRETGKQNPLGHFMECRYSQQADAAQKQRSNSIALVGKPSNVMSKFTWVAHESSPQGGA